MQDILGQIVRHKREEIATARRRVSPADIKARARDAEPPRNFFAAMTRPTNELRVIAEVKKASPSAGIIREDFDPVRIAEQYHDNGAAAISCLTDRRYFKGALAFLRRIKASVPLPVLRKDFIIDPYQVYEARAFGADAVLLIAECLGEAELLDLLILATELKMTTLVEAHDVENLLKVRPHLGFPHPQYTLLGINNRDLRTMTTDLNHTLRMLDLVEQPELLVSESGIRTHADTRKLMAQGINKVLVGEHLMRQPDPGVALKELIQGDGTGNPR